MLEEVADEAQRVFILAQELWGNWTTQFKIPESERNRWDKEFTAYLRRLNGYREILDELDEQSTATHDVYVGLIQRRKGAGPVPDAIMHLYFANQIGILSEHADDMSVGFIGRVIDILPVIHHYADAAADVVTDAAEDAAEGAGEAAAGAFDRVMRPWLIAGGVVSALIVGVLGVVAVDRMTGSKG